MEEEGVLTVSEVTGLLKRCLDAVPFFSSLSVKGEISNLKRYSFGCYFDLKDENCPLPCVFFSSEAGYYSFDGSNGDQYVMKGRLSVYPKRGRYQFFVREAYGEGAGLLALRREELKKKLAAEGLFDEAKKRPLPRYPRKIAVVTAHPSAAEADIVTNSFNRFPLADLYVFPATVQGASAPGSIIKAIRKANGGDYDILVIARGGGSSEDLSAFDDEGVVRAVAESRIPTVTAVGHEIDFTLVDFASDKRVSTPTAAAAAILPDIEEIKAFVMDSRESALNAAKEKIGEAKRNLDFLMKRPYFLNPESIYGLTMERLRALKERAEAAAKARLEREKQEMLRLTSKADGLNPLKVLGRGYALAYANGKLVRHSADVAPGEKMETMVGDGIIVSEVKEARRNG